MTGVNPGGQLSCFGYVVQDESDTYRTAVTHAVRLVGGPSEVARRLQVPLGEVERWLAGDGKPSMGTFLKVIDLLLEEGGKPRRHPKKD